MKTPSESYQRQCDWSEGWDSAERQFAGEINDLAMEIRELRKDNERYAKFIEALGMYTIPEVTQ